MFEEFHTEHIQMFRRHKKAWKQLNYDIIHFLSI